MAFSIAQLQIVVKNATGAAVKLIVSVLKKSTVLTDVPLHKIITY
jgi:hypothetical protein